MSTGLQCHMFSLVSGFCEFVRCQADEFPVEADRAYSGKLAEGEQEAGGVGDHD